MSVRPDYRYWALRELWTVRDAAHVLLGIHPGSVVSIKQLGQFNTIIDNVQDAMDVGTLTPFSHAEIYKPLEDRRIRPMELLKWWQSKGFEIPKELSYLLESDGSNPVEEKLTHPNQQTTMISGKRRPGDLTVIVDDVKETVTVSSQVGSDKKTKYTRSDIVGKGTSTWELLVTFAKYDGSLEGNASADVKKINKSANRINLGEKLMTTLDLVKSPIIKDQAGVMCFRSIGLAGSTSSADAMDRKTRSLDELGTDFLETKGYDMPPPD